MSQRIMREQNSFTAMKIFLNNDSIFSLLSFKYAHSEGYFWLLRWYLSKQHNKVHFSYHNTSYTESSTVQFSLPRPTLAAQQKEALNSFINFSFSVQWRGAHLTSYFCRTESKCLSKFKIALSLCNKRQKSIILMTSGFLAKNKVIFLKIQSKN